MTDFNVQFYESIDELTPAIIEQWKNLESRALEPNAYLSPNFILPAVKHLTPEKKLVIVIIDKVIDDSRITLAIGIFEEVPMSIKFPFRYLRTYMSTHSFLTGILCDKKYAAEVTTKLLEELKYKRRWGAALIGHNTHFYDPVVRGRSASLSQHTKWHEENEWQRSVLYPKQAGEEALKKVLSKQRYKNIKRKSRQLDSMGDLQWRFTSGNDVTESMVKDFLALENSGWKKESAGSLASSTEGEQFFLEISRNFCLDNSAFVTEILLDNKVIASTFNFISCGAGFAFKLGWDASFAKQSVGFLNECELVSAAPEALAQLYFIESGGEPGSFMDDIWPGRHRLVSGFYTFNRGISTYLFILRLARKAFSLWPFYKKA